MTPLAWSAITDFALAGETLFLGGMLFGRRQSIGAASWYWSFVATFLGFAAFFAAVDHGFIEGRDILPSTNFVTRISWICIGVAVAAMLAGLMQQYFPRQRWVLVVAAAQFVVYVIVILIQDQFIAVSINMLPELLLALGCGLLRLRSRPESLPLALGIVVVIVGAVVQAVGVDALSPIDHNSLYHLITMIGIACLYAAGRKFSASTGPAA